MLQIVLYDDRLMRNKLFPIVCDKSIATLRVGLFSIQEKWEHLVQEKPALLVPQFLQEKYVPQKTTYSSDAIFVNSVILPNEKLLADFLSLKNNEVIVYNDVCVARKNNPYEVIESQQLIFKKINYHVDIIDHCWRVVQLQEKYFQQECEAYCQSKKIFPTEMLSPHTTLIGDASKLYIGKNTNTDGAIFDTRKGAIIIEDEVTILPNSVLMGPMCIGQNSTIKAGTQIYGTTIVGAHCTLGGEIKNTLIGNYSNKGHYGYIGDAYIGDWCNLGAGVTASNLKNTASDIVIKQKYTTPYSIGNKGGCVIGSYSKIGVGVYLDTATIVSICCNMTNTTIRDKYYPPFMWHNSKKYEFKKALTHINNWMAFKNQQLTEIEKKILAHLYQQENGEENL